MNFFERQAAARRSSTRLLVLFALAVIFIVLAVELGLVIAIGPSTGVLVFGAIATLAVIALGSLYRVSSLSDGGEVIAREMGGVEVAADTQDFDLRRLRNVVEEIAIASGVPVPKLFVLEREDGINAFAAGYSPADAAIAVTRGALKRLNRDELQGVIAHEFSHVLNGDMRLNIRLIGVLFGILMIGLAGRKVLEGAGRVRSRGSGGFFVAALGLMAIGYAGLFFARMIKAGISRSRETLADASAVQFTRQSAGLAGALKKIGGVGEGALLSHRGEAEEVSHMLFGDGVGFSGWFATHPPLIARIQALEPGFDARQLEALRARWLASPPDGAGEDRLLGFSAGGAGELPSRAGEVAIQPRRVADQVAHPDEGDYQAAESIIATLPDDLRFLAGQQQGAIIVALGLLISSDTALATRQRDAIAARMGEAIAADAHALAFSRLHGLHPMLRLPLAALAFPALRRQTSATLDAFLAACDEVSHADGEVSLFEYCLSRMLQVQVREALAPAASRAFGMRKLATLRPQIVTLLAVLAREGHADPQQARRAYAEGIGRLFPNEALPYPALRGGVEALDTIWHPLDRLDPLGKQLLLEAISATIAHDGRVSVAESELLRAICATLHCPLPPILQS